MLGCPRRFSGGNFNVLNVSYTFKKTMNRRRTGTTSGIFKIQWVIQWERYRLKGGVKKRRNEERASQWHCLEVLNR